MKTFPSSAQQKAQLGKLRGVTNLKAKGPGVEEPTLSIEYVLAGWTKGTPNSKPVLPSSCRTLPLNTQKPAGTCPTAFGGSPRPAVEDFSSLDAGQHSKPHAGFGKLIPLHYCFFTGGHLSFPFPKA